MLMTARGAARACSRPARTPAAALRRGLDRRRLRRAQLPWQLLGRRPAAPACVCVAGRTGAACAVDCRATAGANGRPRSGRAPRSQGRPTRRWPRRSACRGGGAARARARQQQDVRARAAGAAPRARTARASKTAMATARAAASRPACARASPSSPERPVSGLPRARAGATAAARVATEARACVRTAGVVPTASTRAARRYAWPRRCAPQASASTASTNVTQATTQARPRARWRPHRGTGRARAPCVAAATHACTAATATALAAAPLPAARATRAGAARGASGPSARCRAGSTAGATRACARATPALRGSTAAAARVSTAAAAMVSASSPGRANSRSWALAAATRLGRPRLQRGLALSAGGGLDRGRGRTNRVSPEMDGSTFSCGKFRGGRKFSS